jgi:hypothetical protein
VQVKSTNDFSEDFDVHLSSGFMRRGTGAYRRSCTPASFPLPPDPDGPPPVWSRCRKPYPPPISRFASKIHTKGTEFWTLDSTPIVGPDAAYCRSIGFTDGRNLCPVRPEGSPQRVACENWRVGIARDTGRPGPTWTRNGELCTGANGCRNHPDNQYGLFVTAGGTYAMCAENGACGEVVVDR